MRMGNGWSKLAAAAGLLMASLLTGCTTAIVNYGTISTIAGTGKAGYSGDGGAATSAMLGSPACVAVDAAGNVYTADSANHVIRRITSAGVISTFAGTGTAGYSGDGGQATAAQLDAPQGCTVDASGNLYIADTMNNVIRRVAAGTGVITTVLGTGQGAGSTGGAFGGDGGPAVLASLNHPFGIAVDTAGNLYVGDTLNQRVRKLTVSTGIVTTIGGNGSTGLSGDGGAGTSATMYNPEGLTVDGSGKVFVAEEANSVIRLITASGTISTYAGGTKYGFEGNGKAAIDAQLDGPTSVTLDSAGILYFTDAANQQVRRVTTDGTIQTVAGNGNTGYTGNGGDATDAALNRPRGVVIASGGTMYIADTANSVVRKVTH